MEKLKELLVEWGGRMIGGVKLAASSIVARVLAAFGLTWVSFSYVLPEVKAFVQGFSNGLPQWLVQIMGALGVDVFMTMILSAIVAKVGLRVVLAGVSALHNMVGEAGG